METQEPLDAMNFPPIFMTAGQLLGRLGGAGWKKICLFTSAVQVSESFFFSLSPSVEIILSQCTLGMETVIKQQI